MKHLILAAAATLLVASGCKKDEEPKAEPAEEAKAEGAHDDRIKLTEEAAAGAQLKTAKAVRRTLSKGVVAPARLAFSQTGVARVAARVPGRLVDLDVKLGDSVKKGQILAHVESPELGEARASYLSAATRARVAEQNFKRERELLQKGITSEREMRQAEGEFATAQSEANAAEARLHAVGLSDGEIRALKADEHYTSSFPVRAPIDGTVVEVLATVGQSIESTTTLFTVGDLTSLWALIDISESLLPLVKVGQRVDLTVSAVPDARFQGTVEGIGDIVEEKTRTIPVRVVVPNPARLLKAGMFAQAELGTAPATDGGSDDGRMRVVVPREAVQKVGEESYVFVPEGNNAFKPVRVRVGEVSAKEAEILSGLEAGAEVVTAGSFILKSELSKESLGEDE